MSTPLSFYQLPSTFGNSSHILGTPFSLKSHQLLSTSISFYQLPSIILYYLQLTPLKFIQLPYDFPNSPRSQLFSTSFNFSQLVINFLHCPELFATLFSLNIPRLFSSLLSLNSFSFLNSLNLFNSVNVSHLP